MSTHRSIWSRKFNDWIPRGSEEHERRVNLIGQFFEKFTGKPLFLTVAKKGFPNPKKQFTNYLL